eukprot:1017735-Amphidinium_carterae.1
MCSECCTAPRVIRTRSPPKVHQSYLVIQLFGYADYNATDSRCSDTTTVSSIESMIGGKTVITATSIQCTSH